MRKLPLNDGTVGNRYPWGLTRKRGTKQRFGITFGKTMYGYHFGKRSVYIERSAPLKYLWNFAG